MSAGPYRVCTAEPQQGPPVLSNDDMLEAMRASVDRVSFCAGPGRIWAAHLHRMERDGCDAAPYGYGDTPSGAVFALWHHYHRMLAEGWVRS